MTASPARGGAFLIEPVESREVFICADFGETELMYVKTVEDFVDKEVLPRLKEIEAQQEGVMPALLKRAGELGAADVGHPGTNCTEPAGGDPTGSKLCEIRVSLGHGGGKNPS